MVTKIRVQAVHFNWFPNPKIQPGYECQRFIVGLAYDEVTGSGKKVTEIIHCMPCSREEHYCEIIFSDGSRETVYNLNRVFYETF